MKLTTFNKHADEDNRGLRKFEAKLVYITGKPDNIIELGKFLTKCGSEMKKSTTSFHLHFRSYLTSWHPGMADVVVDQLPKKSVKAIKRRQKS